MYKSEWEIKRIVNGSAVVVAKVHALQYTGSWMGECSISVDIMSPEPIDFHYGDYIEYRTISFNVDDGNGGTTRISENERFVLNYDPSVIKKARRGTYGEGFTYSGIKFNNYSDELTRCRFLDVVPSDNQIHYTSLPSFSFYAENVTDLAERLQANLDRLYKDGNGNGLWRVFVYAGSEGNKRYYDARTDMSDASGFEIVNQNVTIENNTCWDALALAQSTFEENFIIRNRYIIIGTAGLDASKVFEYGKDNGLYEIERTVDSSQATVTRLRAYGNTTNMPPRYYQRLAGQVFFDYDSERDAITGFKATFFTGDEFARCYNNGVRMEAWDRYCLGENDKAYKLRLKIKYTQNDEEYSEEVYAMGAYSMEQGYPSYIMVSGDFDEYSKARSFILKISGGVTARIYVTYGITFDKVPPQNITYDTFPNNLAVMRLMLPGFPDRTLYESNGEQDGCHEANTGEYDDGAQEYSGEVYDPYIDSPNVHEIGVREATVFFDGSSDNLKDIYPSIEEVTVRDARAAGLSLPSSYSDDLRIDSVLVGDNVTDNGVYSSGTVPNFTIRVPNPGFALDEYLTNAPETVRISMKDGFCGGREFEVRGCESDGNDIPAYYELTLGRVEDTSLQLWFPYEQGDIGNAYHICQGDKFVYLGIYMPDEYVYIASQRLLYAAKEWLQDNDYVRYTWTPKIDEIYMAREYDEAVANNRTPLHDLLKEGDYFRFDDADLAVSANIFIDNLTIKEGASLIPTYEITLREEKDVGTIQRMQNQITSIRYGYAGSGGYTKQQLDGIIRNTGRSEFLSKIEDDEAQGKITFNGGVEIKGDAVAETVKSNYFASGLLGSGFSLNIDELGASNLEVDNLLVRVKAFFSELEIRKISYTGGNYIFSAAGSTIIKVVPYASGGDVVSGSDSVETGGVSVSTATPAVEGGSVSFYRCYFNQDDGTTATQNWWQVGDQARCKTFNIESGVYSGVSNKDYWRLVVGVGVDYVDLSNTDLSGSDIPEVGDVIVQLGNRSVANRQNAIMLNVTDTIAGYAAPSIIQFSGITGYSLTGKEVTAFSPSGNLISGVLRIINSNNEYETLVNGGKVKTSLLDVDTIIAQGIQAKTIDAENAKFKNLNLIGLLQHLPITIDVDNPDEVISDDYWNYVDFKSLGYLVYLDGVGHTRTKIGMPYLGENNGYDGNGYLSTMTKERLVACKLCDNTTALESKKGIDALRGLLGSEITIYNLTDNSVSVDCCDYNTQGSYTIDSNKSMKFTLKRAVSTATNPDYSSYGKEILYWEGDKTNDFPRGYGFAIQ